MAAGSQSPASGRCQAKSQGRSKFQADGRQRRGPAFAAVAAPPGKAGLAVAADRTQVELQRKPHRQGEAVRPMLSPRATRSRRRAAETNRKGSTENSRKTPSRSIGPVSIAWSAPFPLPVRILRGITWKREPSACGLPAPDRRFLGLPWRSPINEKCCVVR